MKNTRRPVPTVKQRSESARTRHHSLHKPSGRVPKILRGYWKRFSHNWSEHFAERNQARMANKERGVA